MSTPQNGLLWDASAAPTFLILDAIDPKTSVAAAKTLMTELDAQIAEVAARGAGEKLACNVGFGAEFWSQLMPDEAPRELSPFEAIKGTGGSAPQTGGDLLLHIACDRRDMSYELAQRLRGILGDAFAIQLDVSGFRYFDSRDLTGFIDGTANPDPEERGEVVLIGDEDSSFAGGSYALAQRYVHNMAYWSRLSPEEQERAIGRKLEDGEELTGDDLPETAHKSRVEIEEDGHELKIMRVSSPYGDMSEAGLFFLAFCKTPSTFKRMLERMFGTSGDGLSDRLQDFTRAESGAIFFIPAKDYFSTSEE